MAINKLLYPGKIHLNVFLLLSLILFILSCQDKSSNKQEEYITIDIDTIITR